MAKSELFTNSVISSLLRQAGAFPVRRDRADRTAIRTAMRLLEEGKVLGLFPEGTRSENGELLQAHHGTALIALRSGAPILPVAISGPYRIGHPLRVKIGSLFKPAATHQNGTRRVSLEQTSGEIMARIGALLP